MGAFEYTALDASGRNKRGVLEGDTARQIRQKLRDQGLTPLDVEEVERQVKAKRNWQFSLKNVGTSISSMDLALITRQLATLLRSGLPIEEALRSVGKQSGKPRIERIILAVRSRIREGHSFASGLAEFPNTFPELYCKTVEAGEQTGHMDIILERLADLTPSQAIKVLAVTRADLFIPILTHVYGEAQLGGKACIISTHRLNEGLGSETGDDFRYRVIKEAIHELGHTFNLRHCEDHTCCMHY